MESRPRKTRAEVSSSHFFETQQVFVLWLRDSTRETYTQRHSVDGSSPVHWALAKEARKIKSKYEDFVSKTFPITSEESWSGSESEEEEGTWLTVKKTNKFGNL